MPHTRALSLMVLVFTLLGSNALSFAQGARGSIRPSHLVVKVTSYFERNSEAKLEGSGFLFTRDGLLFVLTSDHVVVPTNAPAVHVIENERDDKAEAVFLQANWAYGLALLGVKTERGRSFTDSAYPRFDDLFTYLPIDRADYRYKAMGFPAGSSTLKSIDAHRSQNQSPAGTVLALKSVYGIESMAAEFGMSGGPVFVGDDTFFGLLSHVTLGEVSRTFMIPRWEAIHWVQNPVPGPFSRTPEDIQAQLFSRVPIEAILHTETKTRIERREGRFYVSREDSSNEIPSPALHQDSSLFRLLTEMKRRGEPEVVVHGFGGGARAQPIVADRNLSLQQFAGLLLRTDVSVHMNGSLPPSVQPNDANFSNSRITVPTTRTQETRVEFFFERIGASASYRLTKRVGGRRGRTVEGRSMQTVLSIGVRAGRRVSDVVVWNGGPSKTEERVPEALGSFEYWMHVKMWCSKDFGGTLQVVDVPAGRFQTCAFNRGANRVYLGPVPVEGIVKIEALDGSFTQELVEASY